MKDRKFLTQMLVAFVLGIAIACTTTFTITKSQIEAGIGAEVVSLEQQVETSRDNRDSYRQSSLNCSFAYQTLKNFILNEDFSGQDLKNITADIQRYDKVCTIIPATGVGGR